MVAEGNATYTATTVLSTPAEWADSALQRIQAQKQARTARTALIQGIDRRQQECTSGETDVQGIAATGPHNMRRL